jgi:hypothetical protein
MRCRRWQDSARNVLRQAQPERGCRVADRAMIEQIHRLAGGLRQVALQFRSGKPDGRMIIGNRDSDRCHHRHAFPLQKVVVNA